MIIQIILIIATLIGCFYIADMLTKDLLKKEGKIYAENK